MKRVVLLSLTIVLLLVLTGCPPVQKMDDSTLKELALNGLAISDFNPKITEYTIELPKGTTEVPTITSIPSVEGVTIEVINAETIPGTTTIIVTALDGKTMTTYYIHFTVAKNNDSSLRALEYNAIPVPGFKSDKFDYEVILPVGTTDLPVVSATASDSKATIQIAQVSELPGTAIATATAEDGVTTSTYSILFIPQHTITTSANPPDGGTVTGAGNYNHGTQVNLTATPNNGYEFVDWTDNGVQVSTNASYSFTATTDRALVANFRLKTYTITASAGDGGSIAPFGNVSVNHGENKTFTITPNQGYSIEDLTVDGQSVGPKKSYTFDNITANHTIHANFSSLPPTTFTVTFNVSDDQEEVWGASVTFNGETKNTDAQGKAVFIEVLTGSKAYTVSKEGYNDATGDVNVDDNRTIDVFLIKKTYSLTIEVVGQGTVTKNPDKVTYSHGDIVELTANPAQDWSFTGWSGDLSGSTNPVNITMNGNRTVTATFIMINQYTITVSANPTVGGVVAGGGNYQHGDQVDLTATPNEGYEFINWTENGTVVSDQANYSFTATKDRTLVANFRLKTYTIAASSGNGGSIDPVGNIKVKYGTDKEFTMNPDEGYEIDDVLVDDVSVGAVTFYKFENVTTDHTIHVTFKIKTYTITLTASPTDGGTVDGGGSFKHGDEVTAVATPNEGKSFLNWTEDGIEVSEDPVYKFMATKNRTLVANFRGNRPPEEPQLISPENAALLINTSSVELHWECNDPDNQLLTYDVYLGENIQILEVIATQSATSFLVEGITVGKTYYWMIVARDPFGDETPSEVFSFSTDYYLIPGGEFEGTISGYALMTKANSPYIITGDIIVEIEAQLIIEPGVEVRFSYISDPENNGQEDTNAADLIVYGKLFAEGSETEPILFTSNETPALKGDWGGIRFASSEGTSTISHATIELAKDGVWTSSNCNIEISNCQIRTNIDCGVRLGSNSNATIVDSTISLNGTGIGNYGTMIIQGCTISSNGGTGVNSDGVHIEIYDSSIGENSSRGVYLSNSIYYSKLQNCHILDNGSYGIEGNRFEVTDSSFARNGNRAVQGSDYIIEGCLFTESIRGIYGSSITVVNNTFEGEFSSSFSSEYSGVYITGQALILHNAFSGYSTGIWINTSGELVITDNLVTGNYRGFYFQNANGQNLTCSNNNIYGNRDWNIYNNTNQRIAITDSFWGTDNENVIKSKIFDYYEDPNNGPVSYTGFRSSLVDGATSSKKIAVMPYDRQSLGFVNEIMIEWTAYDPEALIELFDLYFGDAEAPEIYAEDVISPVSIPIDHGMIYYLNVMGFNSQGSLEAESIVSEICIVLPKVFGGSNNDYGYSIVETADGGFVVTGYMDSLGNNSQVYLLKTDSNGNLLWEKNFGESGYYRGQSVIETTDRGLVVTGSYGPSSGGRSQCYLLKTDSAGNILWEKNFGDSTYTNGYSVIETADGGLVVTGDTWSLSNLSQVYLLKVDSTGNRLWEKNFSGSSEDVGQSGYSVVETTDGGLVVTGCTEFIDNDLDNDHIELYLLKIDSTGNRLWEKNFSGSSEDVGQKFDSGYSVVVTSDGGLVVTGCTSSFGNCSQVYLMKTDSNGNLLWEQSFGSTSCGHGNSIIETVDSGLVVTGYKESFGNNYQVYLLKTDPDGNLLWENNFGGSSHDIGYSIVETKNGYLGVVGNTTSFGNGSQVYMIWTDSEGNGISEPGW